MTDYFALLNFARTPWLDAAEVQARFLEFSSTAHPDKAHNSGASEVAEANRQFAELNKAAATLREPKDRLHHLLALETGAAPAASQNISEDLIGLFSRVGETNRQVDRFVVERARATSPMLQAQFFGQALDWSDKVAALQTEVGAVKGTAESELKTIASEWPATKPLQRLQQLAHVFAMVARWEAQLQERFAALA